MPSFHPNPKIILAGCSINYLFVSGSLINRSRGFKEFWATASLRVINEVPHIRATVAGKKVLISEATIRADLLFDDTDGVDCFPKQVLWDSLRDIGYEGNLAQLTFSKPLFSPQWKYLVHVLLHCLSPKSTSWEQFGTNIASALNSPKFSGRITPLTPPMLEVVTALAAEEAHSESTHSQAENSPRDAQGTPTQSAAQDSSPQGTAASQGTADLQGTAHTQGTAASQGTNDIPKSPHDYTPTDASQTSGGDEGLLDLYALNREVRRLKKQTLSQAKQIHKLKAKLKKLSKFVQPWKKHKKKVSSVKVGRNKDEGTLSEEHYVQEDYTVDVFFEALERKSDENVKKSMCEEAQKRLLCKDSVYTDVRETYDNSCEMSIKDSFKDFIPMGLEKERQLLQERDTKRLLRKRKATISEEKPSKKLKLRTETIERLETILGLVLTLSLWMGQRFNVAERKISVSRDVMLRMLDHGN
ncbi:hypothetical protein Tco_1376202 [Tanacetum coccineum]